MAYWRMQLHPDDSKRSAYHAASCIVRGVIGLDFRTDVGDLRAPHGEIESGQKDYRLFHSEMKVDDLVLVQSHHHPFALVKVASDYAYVPNAKEAFGVWFRHLRLVKDVRLYADLVKSPSDWEKITMTDTLARLNNKEGIAYRLIERWDGAA